MRREKKRATQHRKSANSATLKAGIKITALANAKYKQETQTG